MPYYEPTSFDYSRANELHDLKRKLDEATARACRFGRHIEKLGSKVPEQDAKWWSGHKQFDKREGRG